MIEADVTVADKALLALVGTGLDPVGRRLAEDLVKAMPQAELDAVFLALPVLDGLVRREIHARAKAEVVEPPQCGAQPRSGEPRGGVGCDLLRGHTGNHMVPLRSDAGDVGYLRWS